MACAVRVRPGRLALRWELPGARCGLPAAPICAPSDRAPCAREMQAQTVNGQAQLASLPRGLAKSDWAPGGAAPGAVMAGVSDAAMRKEWYSR
jgi:hypothetical protein